MSPVETARPLQEDYRLGKDFLSSQATAAIFPYQASHELHMDCLTAPLFSGLHPAVGVPSPSMRRLASPAHPADGRGHWGSDTHVKGSLHSSEGRAKQRKAAGLSCLRLCLFLETKLLQRNYRAPELKPGELRQFAGTTICCSSNCLFFRKQYIELNLRTSAPDLKTIENLCSCFDWDFEFRGMSVNAPRHPGNH